MSICLACEKSRELAEEHIIPQSLGGRLKANLYCKDCNDKFGRDIDSELFNQYGRFATILRIKRERGVPQLFEVKDVSKEITLTFDGVNFQRKDPVVILEHEEDGKTLKSANITARSESELKKICGSIKKKYNLNHDIKTFQDIHQGPTDTVHEFTIDNNLIRRAITKIAYSFLCTKISKSKILSPAFRDARAYIKEGVGCDLAHLNFIHTQFMIDYTRPLHKIHIALNKNRNFVVGYVSIFGIFRFTVLLSENFRSQFEWPGLDYTYDPVRGKEIFGNENFRARPLNKEEILCPKQSKSFVVSQLCEGQKVIENYVEGFKFLGGEIN